MSLRSVFVGLLMFISTSLVANDTVLQVNDAWIPEAPPVAKMHAGYLEVINPSDRDINITGASSDAYKAVEIHQTVTRDGMAKMVRQQALAVPKKGQVRFERGGLHLMLMHPKQPIKVGDNVVIQLQTDSGQSLAFTATVKPATLDDHSHHHHHH